MTISQRIFAILKEKKLKQKELAQKTGISESAISDWKKKGTNPASENISAIADFLGVTLEYLVTGKEKSPSLPDDELELLTYYKRLPEREQQRLIGRAAGIADMYEEQINRKKIITVMTNIKVFNIAAGAGVPAPFSEDDEYTIRQFPQSDVPTNASCGVYINGESMEPKYPDGCIVWVKETQEVNYGDVVIAIMNGEPFCKVYQPDGLYSINEEYDPILVTENDNFLMFGKVLGYYVE